MVKLLFNNAKAIVKFNRTFTKPFRIKKQVMQGYPIAPYLFLIATKVFNTMIVNEAKFKLIKDI